MREQIIVTIGREHGSGGHYIGKMLAERLGIGFYDREIEDAITRECGYSPDFVSKMDEKPKNFFLSRRVGDFSNSLEENVAEKTFELLRKLASSGESFVVVGRCADHVLKDDPNVFRLFIGCEMGAKISRVMETDHVFAEKAREIIRSMDRQRKAYHNYYCDTKWGDSRGYDLVVNSGKLGMETTAALLAQYVDAFRQQDGSVR